MIREGIPRATLNIEPYPAPRMTRSDKWKTNPNHPDPKKRQRVCVEKYFKFKNEFVWSCKQQKYDLESEVTLIFIISMPDSWSNKKKEYMNNLPHTSRPDIDNLIKSVLDSFNKDDGFVYSIHAEKYWGYKGQIMIL